MKVPPSIPLLLLVFLFGCISDEAVAASSSAPRASVLLGCYAQDANGPITMRVDKENGHYALVAIHEDGSTKKTLTLYSREAKASQAQAADKIDALISDSLGVIAIIKSKNGVPINTTSPGSDIYLYAPQVGGPLFERPCPKARDHSPTSRPGGPRSAGA